MQIWIRIKVAVKITRITNQQCAIFVLILLANVYYLLPWDFEQRFSEKRQQTNSDWCDIDDFYKYP